MKKFKIIGSYEFDEVLVTLDSDIEIVYVPLLDKFKKLSYGLDSIIRKIKRLGILPSESGYDLMCFASLVYLSDTRISRALHSQDTWTREIIVSLPVGNIDAWNSAKSKISRMLNFLTGDIWTIEFSKREYFFDLSESEETLDGEFDVVSLFSGGMDSLISSINLLEEGKRLVLVSHAGDGVTKKSQRDILDEFSEKYSANMFEYLDLWMVFEKKFILDGGEEKTTRSRSFLFIAFAVFITSGIDGINEVVIPENGLIALNVPLDNLRVGSHSTRTTHPFYLMMWNDILMKVGLDIDMINPFWNMTKGEMASECLNKGFLYEIIDKSMSCSSPVKATWNHNPPQHCGYCVPCIIRRAAMNKAFGFGADNTVYTTLSVSDIVRNHSSGQGVQLRSFQYAISRVKNNPLVARTLIHKSGPLNHDKTYLEELASMYVRGLMEVDNFISNSEEAEKC